MRPGRVVGIDVARALALFGMMATHILSSTGDDGHVSLSHEIASGRASALFAVLAGVSLALMSGRRTPQRGRERGATAAGLVVRAALIALIGLLLGGVDSGIAVILTHYGVMFLLAIPFLGLGARPLLIVGAAWVVVTPVVSHLVRPHLPPPSYDTPTLDSLTAPAQLVADLAFTGYYPVVPWLAYVIVGLGLGRLALERRRTAAAVAAVGAAVALLAVAVSDLLLSQPGVRRTLWATFSGEGASDNLSLTLERGLYGTTPTGSWWWLAVEAPHTATPFDLAHTIGTAMLVIGLCVLAGTVAPRTLRVLFGAGAMTLTLYSAHVLSRSPGLWDGEDLSTYLGQVAVALVIGMAYVLARRRGPLEAAVGEAQTAFRRAAAVRPLR